MAEYELWLADDAGRRLDILPEFFWLSYTRVVSGLGTINFGVSFETFSDKFIPYFKPDWRVEVWRSAAPGVPMRLEDVFMLREARVYTREDNVQVLQFYGRNGIDLLYRRSVLQWGSTYARAVGVPVDDIMKNIVRQQMLYGSAVDGSGVPDNSRAWPQGEFSVQQNLSLGPLVSRAYSDRNVFEILKELKETSLQLNEDSSSNRRIYFDVVPRSLLGVTTTTHSPMGWEFQTFADLRGIDRTGGIEFSPENENLKSPEWSISHLEEVNSVISMGNGTGESQVTMQTTMTDRSTLSRWNLCEGIVNASAETSDQALADAGRAALDKGKPRENLNAILLNTPGGPSAPRCLYGVDWDLGDLVRVNYARKQFEIEILVVYVAVDDAGKETITGRSDVNAGQ